MPQIEYVIAEYPAPRADIFLCENSELSRSQIKKLFEAGAVLQNGKPPKAGARVAAGDELAVTVPAPDVSDLVPENIPLDIVYEDDSLVVVNKPQGLTVHPGAGNAHGTLANALAYRFSALSDLSGAVRPGIVHRLDKDTSGLLVVAKTNAAHAALAKQIGEKTAERRYLAVLDGVLKEDRGTVAGFIGRDTKDRKKFTVVKEGGKYAVTHFTVQKRYKSNTLCEFVLHTGRTHQIRVHAKFLGFPVTGDPVYGKPRAALPGQLLHAYRLSFNHPVTAERLTFEVHPPAAFAGFVEKL
jgi:23S rRNA pseudouridine1911/1915/1917 synthase